MWSVLYKEYYVAESWSEKHQQYHKYINLFPVTIVFRTKKEAEEFVAMEIKTTLKDGKELIRKQANDGCIYKITPVTVAEQKAKLEEYGRYD